MHYLITLEITNLMVPRLLSCILFLSAFAGGSAAYGQKQKIDSLEIVLTKVLDDTSRINTINDLIYYYSDSNNERTVELAKQALLLVNNATSKRQAATIYLNYAYAIETIGQYSESIRYNEKALEILKELNDTSSLSVIFNNLGIGYNQLGDYSMAVHNLLLAIEIDEARKDTTGLGIDYINLSEAYYFSKNYQAAQYWAKRAFNTINANSDRSELPYAAETLALAYIELGKLDSAKILVALSAQIAQAQSIDYLISRNESHWGRIHLKEAKYDSARLHFLKAIKLSDNRYISDIRLPSLILLSKAYLNLGNADAALSHAKEAYDTSISIRNKVWTVESCSVLGEIYERKNQAKEAIRYFKLASVYKDSILEQSVRGSIQAKASNINLENEKRAKQKALQGLEEKDRVVLMQRFILIVAGILLLSLITFIYLIRRASLERKRNNEQLIKNNIQLNRLNQEVNGLINTIVHDLKSPLNSMHGILNVIEMDLANNTTAQEMIKHGHRVLEGGHEIIKQLLELRELEEKPASLTIESTNLNQFTHALCQEFEPYAKQKQITLIIDAADESVEIDQQLVKRMLGNLISNAIKYSPSAKEVNIIAAKREGKLYFEIKDQGQGFTESDREKMYQKFQKLSARPTAGESSHGLGLAIVKLIASRLKATITLESSQGKGSTFLIEIPLA